MTKRVAENRDDKAVTRASSAINAIGLLKGEDDGYRHWLDDGIMLSLLLRTGAQAESDLPRASSWRRIVKDPITSQAGGKVEHSQSDACLRKTDNYLLYPTRPIVFRLDLFEESLKDASAETARRPTSNSAAGKAFPLLSGSLGSQEKEALG